MLKVQEKKPKMENYYSVQLIHGYLEINWKEKSM